MRVDEIQDGHTYSGKSGPNRTVTHHTPVPGNGKTRMQYERHGDGEICWCFVKYFARWAQKDVTGGERNV